LSNAYKAIEVVETNPALTGAEIVYLRAAGDKLDTVTQALYGMRDILARGRPTEATIAWLRALDYDALYSAGTERGLIPAVGEQWERLAKLMASLNHLSVTNSLIADVEALRQKINSSIDILRSTAPDTPLTVEKVECLSAVQTSLVELSTFAQMVSYLNAVEPMDGRWTGRTSA